MGANQSNNSNENNQNIEKQKSLKKTIDYIAANYILTNNFQDMKNLQDPKYCNNLVILTSKVLNEYLTTQEIEFLKQRMEGTKTDSPKEVNTLTKENITYFSDSDLPKLNVTKPLRRKRICIGIAKYYVEIFNLFNSIVHTINPIYTWKDSTNQTVSVGYEMRKDIPKDVNPTITRNNLCSNRLNALLIPNLDISGENVNINTNKVCGLNNQTPEINLQQEIGMPELEKLYYDEYNYTTGKFVSMSEDMKKIYKNDVDQLYKLFTGNQDVPEEINSFSDILLRNVNPNICNYKNTILGNLKNDLYSLYVNKWNEMKAQIENNQDDLLNILEEIFTPIEDPDDPQKKIIIIRKDLTQEKLNNLITLTRNTILNLYQNCENNYQEILKILEAIIEDQEKQTSQQIIQNLQKEKEDILAKQSLLQKNIQEIDEKINQVEK